MIFKSYREEMEEMELNMYKYILEGKQKSFPSGYWEEEGREYQFKSFLLYYIHEVLGYPRNEIPYKIISKKLIGEAKLITPYFILFKNRLEIMFEKIFPEVYPYKMPIICDELWFGKGMWEGQTPLEESFPKWLIEEHYGLNEDNVIGLIKIVDIQGEDLIYRKLIRSRYRSLAKFIHKCYPNKDIEKIKTGIKGRTTSRVALLKRKEANPSIELTEKINIFKSDDNCYYTNTGCNIHLYSENGIDKLRILNYNRKPTYREISFIRYNLLNETEKTYYFNIDEYSNDITLTECVNPSMLTLSEKSLFSSFKDFNENIILDELMTLKDMLPPNDKSFIVTFPPEKVKNYLHILEL